MKDYLFLQIIVISFSTMSIVFILTSHKPFKDVKKNYGAAGLASEAVILIVIDLLQVATDP